jgi:hypothetical protein
MCACYVLLLMVLRGGVAIKSALTFLHDDTTTNMTDYDDARLLLRCFVKKKRHSALSNV